MTEPVVKMACVFGHVQIVPTERWDAVNNRMVLGGYAIHYDETGKEVSRTKDEANLYVYYGESGKKSQSVPSWYRRLWEMFA